MSDEPLAPAERGDYWGDRYPADRRRAPSWYQPRLQMSLQLIDALGVVPSTPVIDVGGGSSTLVDEFVGRGFTDITVLDVSAAALAIARRRLGDPEGVAWLDTDILTWEPPRRWGLWHDRAVFHFLADRDDRAAYLQRMRAALDPGGAFMIATFAPDAPERCSGLPVARYDASALIEQVRTVLGAVRIVVQRREVHTTPNGGEQPFTWIAGTTARAETTR